MKAERYLALDFMRGVSIFGMVFSAIIPYGVLPAWMYHIQNPPPTHQLDMSVSGLSWVDLVFPVFIFCMGAAIPLSGKIKIEKGITAAEYIRGIVVRFIMLWAFSYLYVLTNYTNVEGIAPQIFTLLGFCSLFLIYLSVKNPNRLLFSKSRTNSTTESSGSTTQATGTLSWLKVGTATHIAGILGVVCVITVGHLYFGEVISLQRRGIIIFLLAFLYLFGSLIWYFTHNRPCVRVVFFALLFTFTHITRALDLPSITYANPEIRWWFNMEYFYFLLILIPATIIGDMLSQSTKLQYGKLAIIGSGLFIWGLIMIVIEGSITKVPCTISYCFVTCAICIVLLAVCDFICRKIPGNFIVKTFAGAGQNPLMSYIAFDNLLVPLMKATGLIALYQAAYPQGVHLLGVLRAAITVFFTMYIVSLFSKRNIFWKA